jgi:hypothetical protein
MCMTTFGPVNRQSISSSDRLRVSGSEVALEKCVWNEMHQVYSQNR